ncbi:MAG: recombinase family protein [Alphaproteobacteria bacterium]|nr:recombinase family protein [Alphaproteobacteria bacterium]
MQFYDVVMNTFFEGEINELHIVCNSTINALFLKTLRHQVKCSHEGQALKDKIFAILYGYEMKIRDGCEVNGERDIDPVKAAIIRRAFTLFAEGYSVGLVIGIFNAEGIPLPKGNKWSGSSLHNLWQSTQLRHPEQQNLYQEAYLERQKLQNEP